jgi:glycosyltransferase involved in cell wall biosynthesis
MRILQLTPRLPYPPTDGGRVVMLQVARALERLGAGVRVLSLNPRKQHGDLEAARRALSPVVIDAFDIDTSAHLAALTRAWRLGVPYLVARFFSPHFASELRALLRDGNFEVVQIESPFLLPYVPLIREASSAAVILRSLNVEFRIWEQLAAHQGNPLRRLALHAVARSLRRYEIAQLNTCDALVPITEEDARDFRALGCTRPIHVLQGGVDLADTSVDRSEERPDAVGFIGSLDYRPNQEAALWIAEELKPRIDARVHIGGSNAPAWLRARLAAAGVELAGNVRDAAAFIRPMSVMIAPIFAGGGMRIKILEAMARGKAVVATTVGAAGIEVRDGENILLADDADAFAAAISRLVEEPSRARAIGDAGRRLVETRYASDALARDLLAFYEELTQRRGVHRRR